MDPLPPRKRRTRAEQRAETRERLFLAAEKLFAESGITATPLESVAEAAGYSKGAFYSNFEDRDELIFALLERHQTTSMQEATLLLDQAVTPRGFLDALLLREQTQPSQRTRLSMEYILYATREPAGRERLKELNRTILGQMADVITAQFESATEPLPIEVVEAAKIVLALDEGFALLRLIDPETYPVGIWGDAIMFLNRATTALMKHDR